MIINDTEDAKGLRLQQALPQVYVLLNLLFTGQQDESTDTNREMCQPLTRSWSSGYTARSPCAARLIAAWASGITSCHVMVQQICGDTVCELKTVSAAMRILCKVEEHGMASRAREFKLIELGLYRSSSVQANAAAMRLDAELCMSTVSKCLLHGTQLECRQHLTNKQGSHSRSRRLRACNV